ncbi:hypothetical protein [Phytobacter sp. AG2a]
MSDNWATILIRSQHKKLNLTDHHDTVLAFSLIDVAIRRDERMSVQSYKLKSNAPPNKQGVTLFNANWLRFNNRVPGCGVYHSRCRG